MELQKIEKTHIIVQPTSSSHRSEPKNLIIVLKFVGFFENLKKFFCSPHVIEKLKTILHSVAVDILFYLRPKLSFSYTLICTNYIVFSVHSLAILFLYIILCLLYATTTTNNYNNSRHIVTLWTLI